MNKWLSILHLFYFLCFYFSVLFYSCRILRLLLFFIRFACFRTVAWCLYSISYQFVMLDCLWLEYLCVQPVPKSLICFHYNFFALIKTGNWILPKRWPRIMCHLIHQTSSLLYFIYVLFSRISGISNMSKFPAKGFHVSYVATSCWCLEKVF